jgi:hypothetical protein
MHIMMSVGLLGDAAGFLAVALGAARTDNADTEVELVKVLNMFSLVFGIPLSFGAQARARWNSSKIPPVQELFPVCVRTQN